MRVLLCKIQCSSFICLYKTSPHIYAADSLRLENTPQLGNDDDGEDCSVEEKEHSNGEVLKSGFKKEVLDSEDGERKVKKKVQWGDLVGKELAEIREFESSEEEKRYSGDQTCGCIVM